MQCRKGIALIVTICILTLLSAAATSMVFLTTQLRRVSALRTDAAQVRLLARSGIEYASARLAERSEPVPGDSGTQADDWAYRDDIGVPLEKSRNPSYAQTEPYTDLAGNGRYDSGIDSYIDANRNRRFDAWSGRLRGRHGIVGATFMLKVESEDGKIDVNEGYLDTRDRNQNGVPDHQDPGFRRVQYDDIGASPVYGEEAGPPGSSPAYLDTGGSYVFPGIGGGVGVVSRNRRMADLLVELAQARGVSQPSRVGTDVIRGRPPQGYRSLEQLREALGQEAWDKMGAFLTVFSRDRVRLWGGPSPFQHGPDPGSTVLRHAVNLATAPAPVLQAMAQGISEPAYVPMLNLFLPPGSQIARTVQPPEALALANGIAAQGPFPSWQEFFIWLDRNKLTLFTGGLEEINRKVNAVETGWNPDELEFPFFPSLGYSAIGTASLAEFPLMVLGMPFRSLVPMPSMSWQTYDLDRTAPASNGDRRLRRRPKGSGMHRVSDPPPATTLLPNAPAYGIWGTTPADLAPKASVFGVESLGRGAREFTARFRAAIETTSRIEARSQADFEGEPGNRAGKDRTQTWPTFSSDSYPGQAPVPAFKAAEGTVRLMDFSHRWSGTAAEVFTLPCWEKGQPLRRPEEPAAAMDNFLDVSGKKAVPDAWPATHWETFPGCSAGTTWSWDRSATWPGSDRTGTNDGNFPLVGADGTVRTGTIEWTCLNAVSQINVQKALNAIFHTTLSTSDPNVVQIEFMFGANTSSQLPLRSIRQPTLPEPHAIACTLSADLSTQPGIQGYVDGILDPGLVWPDFEATSVPPGGSLPQLLATGMTDEVRMFTDVQSPPAIRVRGLRPRYWTLLEEPDLVRELDPGDSQELRDRLKTFPSFTSPLYRFDAGVALTGARWDGFVPRLIRDAVDDPFSVPLKVELLLYDGSEGNGAEWHVPFPPEFWLSGGGWADFETIWSAAFPIEPIRKFRSLRFRVWMDASAVTGFNNESPVFDSISIQYRSARLLSLSE